MEAVVRQRCDSTSVGVVSVCGPKGVIRLLRITASDSPVSIEHCLRQLFRLPGSSRLTLLDGEGVAVPLGAGLLHRGSDGGDSRPVYRVEILDDEQPEDDVKVDDFDFDVEERGGRMPAAGSQNSLLSQAKFRFASKRCNVTESELTYSTRRGMFSKPFLQDDVSELIAIVPCQGQLLSPPMVQALPHSVDSPGGTWSSEIIDSRESHVQAMAMRSSSSTMSAMSLGQPNTEPEVLDEVRFWYEVSVGYNRRRRTSFFGGPPMRRLLSVGQRLKCTDLDFDDNFHTVDLATFDCSDQRVQTLYKQWSLNADGILHLHAFRHRLQEEFGVILNGPAFDQALKRVNRVIGRSSKEITDVIDMLAFRVFFQRIMLGAVCRRGKPNGPEDVFLEEDAIELIEYCEHEVKSVFMQEEAVLFKSPLKIPGSNHANIGPLSRWVRTTAASPERLLRLGVKFYLHPIAVSDAIVAARVGMTRIDRYNHQYFVSLEVYALHRPDYQSSAGSRADFVNGEPPAVGCTVLRSVMFLVATGNPQEKHRNWLISVVSKRSSSGTEDPLDFFASSHAAANQILDHVYDDLEASGRLREYQADFLLYSIIDRAVRETTPICIAYGHRVRWLEDQLRVLKLAMKSEYIDEVSNVRQELRELRQWLNQIRGMLKTLSTDCRATDNEAAVVPWNFGAHAEGRGKSLLLFLSSTDANLEQSMDRLSTLDELAVSFLHQHQRHRESFMNNILLTLTVATAVFMPAQLLAGIYGTNFVNEEGNPSIPELTWKYGYPFFLCLCAFVLLSGLGLALFCLRRSIPRHH